jgi:tetratricopeptide (TPR) repeat protein
MAGGEGRGDHERPDLARVREVLPRGIRAAALRLLEDVSDTADDASIIVASGAKLVPRENPPISRSFALASANLCAGRAAKALEYAQTALRLGPRDPLAYAFLRTKGHGLFALGRYDEALETFRQSLAVNPELPDSYAMLAASLAMMGRDADAREMLQRYLALPTGAAKSIAQYKTRQPYDSPFLRELYDRVDQGLRKAGMPES